MKKGVILVCLTLLLFSIPAQAQSSPVKADRDKVEIVGTIGGGAFTGSLRLTTEQEIGNLVIIVADLTDTTGSSVPHDPIPASAITVTPMAEWASLDTGSSVQVGFQVSPPMVAGTWAGTVTIRWLNPAPSEWQLPLTLVARNRPELDLAEPKQLKFVGVRGKQLTRTLVVRETALGSPDTGLQVIKQDLSNDQSDNVLLAEKIEVTLPATEIDGGQWMTISVTLDLKGVSSGEYNGSLWLTDDYHNAVTVPISVLVKDGKALPLALLVLGVMLGRGMAAYRAYGRPRDRLRLRIAAVRDRVKQEERCRGVLSGAVEKLLVQAEADLAAGRFQAGDKMAEQAEALTLRWQQDRAAWIEQVTRMESLSNRLQQDDADAEIIRTLRRRLDQMDLDEFASAEELQDGLAQIDRALVRFEQLADRLRAVKKVLDARLLSQDLVGTWQTRFDGWSMRLSCLSVEADQDMQTLIDEVVSGGQDLKNEIEAYRALQDRKAALLGQVRISIQEMGHPDSPALLVAQAQERVRQRIESESDPETAKAWAENLWRGGWSAQNILVLATDQEGRIAESARALRQWLSDGNHYLQPTESFRPALHDLEATLQTAMDERGEGIQWPLEPALPQAPVAKGMLLDLRTLEGTIGSATAVHAVADSLEALPEPQGCLSGLPSRLVAWGYEYLRHQGGVILARLSLGVFKGVAYLVVIVSLSWLGFNQLYTASPTFGALGAFDYFSLFAWGLGAEATQGAVADLIKGLTSRD